MNRPYASFQIDRLEAEFERASDEEDTKALRQLKAELAPRKQTPRVSRLLQEIEQALGGAPTQGTAPKGPVPVNGPAAPRKALSGTPPQRRAGGKAPSFKPTEEQERAVAAFATGQSLKINAYAGSGKTSTLQLLAHSSPRKGQYLAFNKKIVSDSQGKFPSNVDCNTTHSVAFRSLKRRYAASKLTGKIQPNHLVELLELKDWRVDRNHVLKARSQAYLILATIRRFCQSDASDLLLDHVPRHGSLAAAPEEVIQQVAKTALDGAMHVWARMLSEDDPVPLGHDGYLKVWALSNPCLPVEYILLDEAQDTNPVVLGVLAKQQAQIVYVGDKFQQIYEWRGAVNAMEKVQAAHQTDLTTSFRFGGDVADAANRVLEMLKAGKNLKGNPDRHSRIASAPNGTVLARTNATTITAIIDALDQGKRPHLVGGTEELIAMLRGVRDLKGGQPSSVPEFFGFENWQQVVEFVRSGEGEDLQTFVNLVEQRGENQLMWALGRVADEDECDFVVSTAHKAKGREWPQVRLMDDFLKSLPQREGGQPTATIDPSELRLLYVAITRAKDVLEVPSGLMEFLNTGKLPASALTPRTFGTQARTASASRPAPSANVQAPPPPVWNPPTNWTPSQRSTSPTGNATARSEPLREPVRHEFRPSMPIAVATNERVEAPAREVRQEPPPAPVRPAETEQPKKKTGFFRWLMGG